MATILGEEREVALCRELTKKFEEVRRTTLGELARQIAGTDLKGEVVLVVDRSRRTAGPEELEAALRQALVSHSVKEAARQVAADLGLPRRDVYQAALALSGRNRDPE